MVRVEDKLAVVSKHQVNEQAHEHKHDRDDPLSPRPIGARSGCRCKEGEKDNEREREVLPEKHGDRWRGAFARAD